MIGFRKIILITGVLIVGVVFILATPLIKYLYIYNVFSEPSLDNFKIEVKEGWYSPFFSKYISQQFQAHEYINDSILYYKDTGVINHSAVERIEISEVDCGYLKSKFNTYKYFLENSLSDTFYLNEKDNILGNYEFVIPKYCLQIWTNRKENIEGIVNIKIKKE